ncbi:MAG: hypothetical protein GXX90_08230, partial [Microbacteriaceae bacterium]|nr:hypothetical protein [Microbacteriaceae bacterium]
MRSPDDPRRAAAHDPVALRATDRCPNCGDRRSEAGRCTDCGLDLTRPALAGVHALSLRAAELLERAARTAVEADAVLAERAALLAREREASLTDRARRTEFAVPAEFSGAPAEPAGAPAEAPAPSARPGMPPAGAAPSAPAPA